MTDNLSSTQCRNETLLGADGIRTRVAGPRPKGVTVKAIPSWTKADPGWCNIENLVNPIIIDEALTKVISNRGSGGVDHITTSELRDYWSKYGGTIRQKVMQGTYIPLPVRRVDIPKPNGDKRMLGIPSVIDRVIQQALVNVLDRYLIRNLANSATVSAKDAVLNKQCSKRKATSKTAIDGSWNWTYRSFSTESTTISL